MYQSYPMTSVQQNHLFKNELLNVVHCVYIISTQWKWYAYYFEQCCVVKKLLKTQLLSMESLNCDAKLDKSRHKNWISFCHFSTYNWSMPHRTEIQTDIQYTKHTTFSILLQSLILSFCSFYFLTFVLICLCFYYKSIHNVIVYVAPGASCQQDILVFYISVKNATHCLWQRWFGLC